MERQAKDGTIYKQVGQDEWAPITRTAKDGTVYKKVGADEWAPNDVSVDAPVEKERPWYSVSPSGLLQGSLDALPAAGAMAGGVIGAVGSLGTASVPGALMGAGMGTSAKNFLESALLGKQKTREDIYIEPLKQAALEGVGIGAGKVIGRGAEVVSKYSKQPIESVLAKLAQGNSAKAPLIEAASQRLGVTPTRGMLSGEQFIKNIESGMSQTTSKAGQEIATQQQNLYKGLQSSGAKALEPGITSLTDAQLGGQSKGLINSTLAKRLEPAIETYNKIENEVSKIDIAPISVQRISKNILGLPHAKLLGTPEASFAKMVSTNLENVKTLDELRNLRQYVGKAFDDRNLSGSMRSTAGEVYGRLSQLEQNSITRSAIAASSNPQYGKSIALEMVNEIKDANKIYAVVSNDLKELARNSGMGPVRNHSDFLRKLADIPDERVIDSFFQPDNVKHLQHFQKQFPEAFDVMRKSKMADIYNKSLTKGEISIAKLVNNAKRLTPETRKLIFGEGSDRALQDIEIVHNAIYSPVGPSGTPKGLEYTGFNPFSPTNWYYELTSGAKKTLLDNPEYFSRFKNVEIDRMTENLAKTDLEKMVAEIKNKTAFSLVPRAMVEAASPADNSTAAKRRLNIIQGNK